VNEYECDEYAVVEGNYDNNKDEDEVLYEFFVVVDVD
jgi:hypothetical protein